MDKLHLSEHISRQFNEELEDIRSKVLAMGGLVEEQVRDTITALVNNDRALAERVIATDQRVNAYEMEIDDECTRILARRQPAASDLRLVMAVARTVNDLERIGDESKRVAKLVRNGLERALEEDVRQELEHMGNLVSQMLRQVLDAFARTDARAAVEVMSADHRVDLKYHALSRQLMTYMAQDHTSIPTMLNVLWAARALERMGDRSQNIAEYVVFLVIGRDVRHTSIEDVVRELEARGD